MHVFVYPDNQVSQDLNGSNLKQKQLMQAKAARFTKKLPLPSSSSNILSMDYLQSLYARIMGINFQEIGTFAFSSNDSM